MATPSGTPELEGAELEHDYIDTPDFSLEVSTSEEDDDVILDTEILLSSSRQPTINHFDSSSERMTNSSIRSLLFHLTLPFVLKLMPRREGSPNNDVYTRYAQHAMNMYNMLRPSSGLLTRVYNSVKFYTTWKAKDNPNEKK